MKAMITPDRRKTSDKNARIYLSAMRGCTTSRERTSFHTFNFGDYASPDREPFASLLTVNDDTLRPGQSTRYCSSKRVDCLVIPLVGSCLCKQNDRILETEVGQVFHTSTEGEPVLEIANPYEHEAINFLYIELIPQSQSSSGLYPFSLEERPNLLNRIDVPTAQQFLIGIFDGRTDGGLILPDTHEPLFVFVIEGAFEVNNRLLHRRDGLALWNTDELEFEALSNKAMLLAMKL